MSAQASIYNQIIELHTNGHAKANGLVIPWHKALTAPTPLTLPYNTSTYKELHSSQSPSPSPLHFPQKFRIPLYRRCINPAPTKMTAGRLPYGYPVVKGGSGNELLIETQQAFYVFFRPKTTTSNIDSKSVEDLLFQHRVLRVSIQPNSNGYVAFEVAEEAEEFEKRIILESVYEPITPDEWYNDIDKWLQDEASNKIKQDIAGCEERLDKLNARFQENPTIGLQTAIQIEGESLGKLEECLIRLQSKIEKFITTLKVFLQSRKWSEDAEASLLKAIDDLRQHQPYSVDPNRNGTNNTVQDEPTWSISTTRGFPTSGKTAIYRAERAEHEYLFFGLN
ncbi:hypothetical protein L211DRAFT_871685 [Terfezia boudieri ATCC MYA-4762]|uniref:Uncharacterized protein n=1 Tax=Terfezia boudieri ATCC MYA-4762 TaxID=1051890 RepID=A0A3N4LB27_9PEZI|nr:hypothetical protein L211DRAFT_871685 [Terfezia boudieri ATCC MYA-4762]